MWLVEQRMSLARQLTQVVRTLILETLRSHEKILSMKKGNLYKLH